MNSRPLARREWLAGVAALALAETALSGPRWARADEATPNVARPPPLARFSTSYDPAAEQRARAINIEIAADALERKAIAPGGTLSFNDVVGERTAAFGYERSVVLRRGMLAEGSGGGTCQVASTFHAAALLAGLEIVERCAHSRPSAYIRIGLDATVAFGVVDLKVRNPRPDRVVVRARAARGGLSVWVEADGASRRRVSVATEVVERVPYPRSTVREARVPDDEVHVRAYGIPGYRVVRTRDVAGDEGTRTDVVTDTYPPVARMLVVGASFDVSRIDLNESEETPDGRVTPAFFRAEPGVRRPARVQLRPPTRVVVDNTP